MSKITIDTDYLIYAWRDESPDTSYYLDTDTGSVVLVQRDLDELEELKDEIESQPNRFLYVPKPAADSLLMDMTDFVYTVADESLRAALALALESSHKVSGCQTLLGKHPSELKRWQDYHLQIATQRVRKWLAAHAIDHF